MSVSATYVLEVDWSGDGDYADTSEDITADVLSVDCKRGRDYASQLTGRASAGRLTARLDNTSKKYSSFNASSPIYGLTLPGRRVRLRTTAPTAATLWTGFLDRIQPDSGPGGALFATLTAFGVFEKAASIQINMNAHAAALTGTIMQLIIDAAVAGFVGSIVDAGLTTTSPWWIEENTSSLEAMRQIEETEFGFLYEGIDHDIVFEQRTHRLTGAHLTSQATFSDAGGAARPYMAIGQRDPIDGIYNQALAKVQSVNVGATAVLWALNDFSTASIAPGQTRRYVATYPNDESPSGAAYSQSWVYPVLGTDLVKTGVADGFVSIATTESARRYILDVTNTHPTDTLVISALQVRGVPVSLLQSVEVQSDNAPSQLTYALRSYRLPAKFLPSAEVGQDYCDFVVSRYGNPLPILNITVSANRDATMMAEAVGRAISDRVTVVANGNAGLGINQDFYIEAISHRIDQGKMHHVTSFDLSPTSGDAAYWILGTSALGTDTVLGY